MRRTGSARRCAEPDRRDLDENLEPALPAAQITTAALGLRAPRPEPIRRPAVREPRRSRLPLFGFLHANGPVVELGAIEALNRFGDGTALGEFDESHPPRPARVAIDGQEDVDDLPDL